MYRPTPREWIDVAAAALNRQWRWDENVLVDYEHDHDACCSPSWISAHTVAAEVIRALRDEGILSTDQRIQSMNQQRPEDVLDDPDRYGEFRAEQQPCPKVEPCPDHPRDAARWLT